MRDDLARSLCRRVLEHGTLAGDAECLAALCMELLNERDQRNAATGTEKNLRRQRQARPVQDHHQRGEVAWDQPLRLSAAGRDALRRALAAEEGGAS